MDKILILDLDDTIFETGSMDAQIFEPATSVIFSHFQNENQTFRLEIQKDLWSYPFDFVQSKYDIPSHIIDEFYNQISKIDYNTLKVCPFKDYSIIQKMNIEKILVTTGFKELQLAKVKALNIENDFQSIHIDDPRTSPRNTKLEIFQKILKTSNKKAHDFVVIGDNPNSEIKAGHQLAMKTIQRKSKTKAISDLANHVIDSFESLETIMNL